MKSALTFIFIFFCITAYTQKPFFASGHTFTDAELEEFYSSVKVHDNTVYFVANDYKLYAYDKVTGKQLWLQETGYKSDIPVYICNNIVFTGFTKHNKQYTALLNVNNGAVIKILPFGPFKTTPFIKYQICYTTAVYNGGAILAYDLKNDSIVWSQFIGHGLMQPPYYLNDQILANMENTNWLPLSYQGVIGDSSCKGEINTETEERDCKLSFYMLTHDEMKVDGPLAEKIFGNKSLYNTPCLLTNKHSFVIQNNTLFMLGDKKKLKLAYKLNRLSARSEKGLTALLQADSTNVLFMYNDMLMDFNFNSRKLVKQFDVSFWQPSQVYVDGNNLWLISKKDGRLYGFRIRE